MSKILKAICVLLPWVLRRRILNSYFGYEIDPCARIGLSWIYPKKLIMKAHSKIGHLNTGIHLDIMELGEYASIGRSNWITGFPTGINSKHFAHQPERSSHFILGNHSAITKNHHLDCTHKLSIGKYVTIAGYQSQFLTHSIDIFENRQDSKPIEIGDYCFVSTNVTILGGAKLPNYSVLGAKALLNKPYTESWKLYGGIPARILNDIPKNAEYFNRKTGFVN